MSAVANAMRAAGVPGTERMDRRHFLGGSDAAAVLGISPWKTPFELWQQKTSEFKEEVSPAKQKIFTRGHRMEPYVVDLLSDETGLQISHRNARYIDSEFPFLAAEIDAQAATGENIEIKTVSPFKAADWGELGTDAIPVYYTAQAQHGMMLTAAPVCVFGVLIGGDDFRVYRVERDDEVIAGIRAAEVRFWREHVETLTPPEAANADDVGRLFPRDLGTAIEASTEALIAFNELRQLRAQIKALGQQVDEHEFTLQSFMGGAARLTLDGRDILTWKTQTSRRFDQTAFRAAHPDLAEQFMKSCESRVMRLK